MWWQWWCAYGGGAGVCMGAKGVRAGGRPAGGEGGGLPWREVAQPGGRGTLLCSVRQGYR
jgi:hypothetical protein